LKLSFYIIEEGLDGDDLNQLQKSPDVVSVLCLMGIKKAKQILQVLRILNISRDFHPQPTILTEQQLTPNTKQHLKGKKNIQ